MHLFRVEAPDTVLPGSQEGVFILVGSAPGSFAHLPASSCAYMKPVSGQGRLAGPLAALWKGAHDLPLCRPYAASLLLFTSTAQMKRTRPDGNTCMAMCSASPPASTCSQPWWAWARRWACVWGCIMTC